MILEGTIVDIRMRTTKLELFLDNAMITVPNSQIVNAYFKLVKRTIGRRIK